MSVEILVGGPASGKTETAVRRVLSVMETGRVPKVWILLPDSRQAKAFRQRMEQAGQLLGAATGTFPHLCKELLMGHAALPPTASSTLLYRVLRSVLDEAEAQDRLGSFAAIRSSPGFLGMLQEHFGELQQSGFDLTAPELTDWTEADENLAVILGLYRAYLERLERIEWLDERSLVKRTADWLESEAPEGDLMDLLVVDGFDRFTPAQRRLLKLLDQRSREVLITLGGECGSTRAVHRRFNNTLAALQADIPGIVVHQYEEDSQLPATLAHLAENFLDAEPQRTATGEDLRMLVVQSPAEEVRETLRWIKQRWVENPKAPPSTAVLIPDEATYAGLLRATAREYGLPLHFSFQEPLAGHPGAAVLLELLELIRQDFPRRALIDMLRSPFLDLSSYGFRADDAVRLEFASRYGPVVGGLNNWQAVLRRLAMIAETEGRQNEDEETAGMLPEREEAERIAEALERFAARLQPPEGRRNIVFWTSWLASLLESMGWNRLLAEGGHKEVLSAVREVLQGLKLGEIELGEWQLSYGGFLAELESLLRNTACKPDSVEGPVISVLRMIEARGVRYDLTGLLGLVEGGFPRPERADPFFSESFRAAFGLEPKLNQDQAAVFYQAITRADRATCLTRPYLAKTGESLEPSPFWDAAAACLDEGAVETLRPTDRRKLDQAASMQELFFWAALCGQAVPGAAGLAAVWEVLIERQAVLAARLARVPDGDFEGLLPELPAPLNEAVRDGAGWSPSRLETYISCPMRYWVQYGLGLEEQRIPEPGLQANQLGSLLHEILEKVYPAAADPNDPESVLAALPLVAEELFESAPEHYRFTPTALWRIQQQEWLTALETAIRELGKEGWMPAHHELKFGLDGAPALTLRLEDGRRISLRGLVDRLDRNAEGEYRVVDYKTGSSHLDSKDLEEGTRLQLPLYAMAVRDALSLGEPVEGFYWALLAGKAGSLKLSSFEYADFSGPEGAMELVRAHSEQVINGVAAADFRPEPPAGGCPDYCPAKLWCWRYTPTRRFA